uniref:NR LBD domain-containing protein n=1 Tax=Acrobeloides nanus TaxID=290746 RepID=A0A914DIT6_9BILA
MKCENFAELNFDDKWLLYKNACMIFYKIERFYSSVILFGHSYNDSRVLFYDTTALDYSNKNIKLKDMEQQNNDQWNTYWNPHRNKYLKCVLNPMKEMKLSQFELIYMLAHILWNVGDLENLSEKASRMAEEIFSQISNELHNYYVHEMHLINYAERLTKINRVISATESLLHVKKDLGRVAEIFNLWDLVIVGSELCDQG